MGRRFPANKSASTREGFWSDNGLTAVLFGLFLLSLAGQSISGHLLYNQTQALHRLGPVPYWRYLRTGDFLEGVFENWQAAVLQLASLIIFGVFLRQRGAAHSRKPEEQESKKKKTPSHPGKGGWLYAHSLSIALLLLFVVFFTLHLFAGDAAFNVERTLTHQPPVSMGSFAVSSKFWFATFQTWQAEYFAIALYVILTIFFRQDKSPESKPVNASNKDTGETAD